MPKPMIISPAISGCSACAVLCSANACTIGSGLCSFLALGAGTLPILLTGAILHFG